MPPSVLRLPWESLVHVAATHDTARRRTRRAGVFHDDRPCCPSMHGRCNLRREETENHEGWPEPRPRPPYRFKSHPHRDARACQSTQGSGGAGNLTGLSRRGRRGRRGCRTVVHGAALTGAERGVRSRAGPAGGRGRDRDRDAIGIREGEVRRRGRVGVRV